MQKLLLFKFSLMCIFTSFIAAQAAEKSPRKPAQVSQAQQEQRGVEALQELGFHPEAFNARQQREAGLIRDYQKAWNAYDPSVSSSKSANPDLILGFYSDNAAILYRDMCVPKGLTAKPYFKHYLAALYQGYPKQIWGDGWSQVHLFVGAKPGEWSYYYSFSMYKQGSETGDPAFTGTGMERVQFDDNGKLLSDEVHLILNSGTPACKPN